MTGKSLVFGPDDDAGFFPARDMLLQQFEEWLVGARLAFRERAAEMAGDAGVALNWKWSYADGNLTRWRHSDISEFLLEWCPRKLSLSPDDCAALPATIAAFMSFLGEEGLLASGSSSAPTLAGAAVSLREDFVEQMNDASNFGLAKSLFGAAIADGVDLEDLAHLQQWIAEFNARPDKERRSLLLPDSALASPARPRNRAASGPTLPPVVLPGNAEVAASKQAAPILAMFARLAEYVGDGRRLTQNGNLTLADARALVELMGTGDVIDQKIGDRTFKTKSSAELYRLRQVFAWARKAGVVRVAHGRVIATKAGLALAKDPARGFERAVDALFTIGPLASQRNPDWWLAWPEVTELLDEFAVHILAAPYVAQQPVPLDDMARVATEAVLETFEFRALNDEQVEGHIRTDVVDIMDALVLAGIVRRLDVDAPGDDEGPSSSRRRLGGGSVELTPAGVATTQRLLVAAGYDAPTAGRFADATATELLAGVADDDIAAVMAEIDAWRHRRDPSQAARELAAAAAELQVPMLRHLALVVLGNLDIAIAGPEVEKLAAAPATRGYALCWLVDRGLRDAQVLFDPDDTSWFVDVLDYRLLTAGADGVLEALERTGGPGQQIAVIGDLTQSTSDAAAAVFDAIAATHPTKTVAKAARKAAFQWRSRMAAHQGRTAPTRR